MSLLQELTQYLHDNGIGVQGQNLFYGREPDMPDSCVTLISYMGMEPTWVHDSDLASTDRPRVQVRCRDLLYDDAEAKAKAIKDAFERVTNTQLSGVFYLGITPLQAPFGMGYDQRNRCLVGFNVQVEKYPS